MKQLSKMALLMVLFPSAIYAQFPIAAQQHWIKNEQITSMLDVGVDIEQLKNGTFVVAALYRTSSTVSNVQFRNYDLDGNPTGFSPVNYGGAANEFVGEVRATNDGGFIVAGGTNSYGAGNEDAMLLKYNVAGVLQWQKFFGTAAGSERFTSVEPINGGTGGYRCVGNNGITITDASGNTTATFNTSPAASLSSITNTSDGGFVVVSEGGAPYAKMFKFNSANTQIWSVNLDAEYAEETYPEEVKEASNGDLVIVGWDDDNDFSAWGGFMIRTSSTGTVVANKTYYNNGWVSLCDYQEILLEDFDFDGEGNIIMVGSAQTGGCSATFGTADLYIKTDPMGNVSYGFGSIIPGTWYTYGNIFPDHFETAYGVVSCSECKDGFATTGYVESAGSNDQALTVKKFFDSDYTYDGTSNLGYTNINVTITSNTTWNGTAANKRIANKLVVKAPATLTLTGGNVVQMGLCGKIVVERGATLIVDNSTITSLQGFSKSMWKGIDVWGTSSASQSTAGAQGKVIIRNNSVVENALDAITTIKRDDLGVIDWAGFTGGIIKVTDSKFLNNKRSIQYMSYQNFSPSTLNVISDQGSFRNTTFEVNAQIRRPGVLPSNQVTMWSVNGIGFYGCNFKNTAPPSANSGQKGSGIYSIDARYTVSSYCSSGFFPCPASATVRSKFDNLVYGVWADNGVTNVRNVTVNNSDFNNVNYGVRVRNADLSSITACTFNVPAATFNYGVNLEQCEAFKCEGNEFTGMTPYGNVNMGVIVQNMTNSAAMVYRNNFRGLYVGTWAYGDNLDPAGFGLKMNCDNYLPTPAPNVIDIAVTGGSLNTMIDPIQGLCTSDSKQMVRNTYSAVCAGNENQYLIDKGNTNTIIHANPGGNGQPACTDPSLIPWICSTTPVQNCPSTLGGGKEIAMKLLVVANDNYDGALADLKTNMASGSSESLLNFIATESSSAKIKDELLLSSPWLSDEVLIAMITKTGMNRAHIKDVIVANSPVSDDVLKYLGTIKMNAGLLSNINTAQKQISSRTNVEGLVSYYESERQLLLADIFRYELADTLDDYDSIISIVTKSDWYDTKKLLFDLYIDQNQPTIAAKILEEMKISGKHKDFVEYKSIILDMMLHQEGQVALANGERYREKLRIIARSVDHEYATSAQALLEFFYGESFKNTLILPDGQLTQSKSLIYDAGVTSGTEMLLLYPNPSNESLNINFKELDAAQSNSIEIITPIGQMAGTLQLEGESGVVHFSTANLESGIYFMNLYTNGLLISTSKFTVKH